MRQALEPTVLVMAGMVVVMLLAILVGRTARDERRRRDLALRPGLEQAVGTYLVDERSEPPPPPGSRAARRVLLAIGIEGLTELRGEERARLTRLLEETGIVTATAKELRSRRRLTRRLAAQALAQIESPEAVDALVKGLSDRDLDVRAACALALAELGDPRHVHDLTRTIVEVAESRPGAVAEVLLAIGSTDPGSLALVLEATDSPRIRRLVTAVAGALRLMEYAPAIRHELSSDDGELAAAAAQAAGSIGDLLALDALIVLARDKARPEHVRAAAATALGRLGDERAVPTLEALLCSDRWILQRVAAHALGTLGPRGEDVLRRTDSPHAVIALSR